MADQKVSELSTLTTPASEDLILVVDNPNGTPASKSITLKNLFGAVPANTVVNRLTTNANTTLNGSNTYITANVNATGISTINQLKVANNHLVISTAQTPGSNSATGAAGEIAWDTDYIYVCIADNIWKRVAISSF
tara:strand:- start:389 stop:796 length:408 start_codon:yes stop_codon:yes gene_type:complete